VSSRVWSSELEMVESEVESELEMVERESSRESDGSVTVCGVWGNR
jgi:hypothetical protein